MSMKQTLTNSRMQSFKLCRKKHYWAYEIGFRREVDAKALRMGSAGHEGLDVFKKTGDVAAAVEAVSEQYAHCPEVMDEYEWSIERETMETLVAGYCWRWADQPLDVIASEESFSLPLINPETGSKTPIWNLAGKIDGVIQEDGRTMVLEHKFVADDLDPDSDYWRRLQIDSQITIYTWAARQLGHDVSGVLYDVIRKPTIRPSAIPLLDDDGKKIVLDADGNRVRNKSTKPKKSCPECQGTGQCYELDCPCTYGAWRQTGDKEKGYTLQSRPMTPDEWSEKLLADIGERPDWYFQRVEIARLQDDIDETLAEIWEVQKTIRQAQKTGAWYKTVNMGSCSYCSYFSLCASKYQVDGRSVPEGFVLLNDVHPELD